MYTIEEFDNLKTKILKYILYKKRTETEVRQKFSEFEGDILEDAIEYLKEAGYINDIEYIERSIKEFTVLKNLSIKELSYKLYSKGIEKSVIDSYIYNNKENLLEYEINSAKRIVTKKSRDAEIEDIKEHLYKKGYMEETIKIALEEL